jgi:hypothetical protein
MARFIQATVSTEHAGITRFTRGFAALGSFDAVHALLAALSAIGKPVTRAGVKLASLAAGRAAARKQRTADEKLWNIALSDARVMADLSRAMSRDAARDVRGFY